MEDYKLNDTAADDVVDIDRVDKDPKEAAKLERMLQTERYRRNIMSLDEFEHSYAQLFDKDVALNMDPKQLQLLSKDYLGRIDPYFPVYVVKTKSSNSVNELLKEDNIVYALPAMYNRTGVVNNLGRDGIDIMQAFNNIVATNTDDRFNQKKELYSKSLSIVLNSMNDETKRAENIRVARAMGERAVRRSREVKGTDGALVGEDVQDIPEDMLSELTGAQDVTVEKAVAQEEEEFL